jgi:DNA-binding MarR family transcriptional regulator
MDSSELSTPTLMRLARGTYARAIRAKLHAIGVGDLPRNGVVMLAGIDSADGLRQDLASDLGITKQAVSQLIDTMVTRGYLNRTPDPDDRRRISLELTARGHRVLDAAMDGVDAVDAQLAERLSPEQVAAMRAGLAALAEIKAADSAAGAGRPRRTRRFRRFSPIFPVNDLAAALAHYAALGFETEPYEDGDEYGFASREGVQLHFAAHHDHGARDQGAGDHGAGDRGAAGHAAAGHAASAYLYVQDADELYEEWSRPGIGGTTRPVHSTPYQIREGSHVDPDGNLIRFGSFVDD